jgi:hypothetical protein
MLTKDDDETRARQKREPATPSQANNLKKLLHGRSPRLPGVEMAAENHDTAAKRHQALLLLEQAGDWSEQKLPLNPRKRVRKVLQLVPAVHHAIQQQLVPLGNRGRIHGFVVEVMACRHIEEGRVFCCC